MRKFIIGAAVLGVAALLAPGVAQARPGYKTTFAQVYNVKPGSNLDKASCGVCHNGPDKTIRNQYGMDLAKALGKANASPQETTAALKKIENMPSADKKTKYVELIKEDKLPAGAPK
jgi:hypothetical protein